MKIQKPGASGVAQAPGGSWMPSGVFVSRNKQANKRNPLIFDSGGFLHYSVIVWVRFWGKEGRFAVLVSNPALQAPHEGRCALPAPSRPSAPGLLLAGCKNPSASTKRTPLSRFAERLPGTKPLSSSARRISFTARGRLLRIFYAQVPVCNRMLPFPRHGGCWRSLKSRVRSRSV